MKKINFAILIFLLLTSLAPAITIAADLVNMGEPCKENSQCKSGDCEDSNVEYNREKLSFCDCDDDQDCLRELGNPGENWTCQDGNSAPQQSHDVDYCQKQGEPAIFKVTAEKIRLAQQQYGAPPKKDMGKFCNTNSECYTNDCELSDIKLTFCDCSTDQDCVAEYGPGWECINGGADNHNVDYCQKGSEKKSLLTDDLIAAAKKDSQTDNLGVQAEQEAAKTPIKLTAPKLAVLIPGLKQWTDRTSTPGETISVPYLVEYILALYRYGVIIGAFVAAIAFLVGGFLYMTAGGLPQNVQRAKEVIMGSVTGLALLLGAHMMLKIINPNLISLKPIEIKTIATEFDFGQATAIDHSSGGESVQPEKPATVASVNPSKPSGDSFVDFSLLGQLDQISKKERPLSSIKYVVLHEGGNAQNIVNYWKGLASKKTYVSSHYSIDKNGKIYQLLDEKRVAYHAGSWNDASIGIDLEGSLPSTIFSTECLEKCKAKKIKGCENKEAAIQKCGMVRSKEQNEALKKLLQVIASRTSLVIDAQHVVAHCAISKVGQRADPRGLDWTQLGINTADAYSLNNGSKNCIFAPKHYEQTVEAANKIWAK